MINGSVLLFDPGLAGRVTSHEFEPRSLPQWHGAGRDSRLSAWQVNGSGRVSSCGSSPTPANLRLSAAGSPPRDNLHGVTSPTTRTPAGCTNWAATPSDKPRGWLFVGVVSLSPLKGDRGVGHEDCAERSWLREGVPKEGWTPGESNGQVDYGNRGRGGWWRPFSCSSAVPAGLPLPSPCSLSTAAPLRFLVALRPNASCSALLRLYASSWR
eukprot:768751-Hanusia_phi.AAC.1